MIIHHISTTVLVVGSMLLGGQAMADGSSASQAGSALSAHGSATVVSGAAELLENGAKLSVGAIKTSGEFSTIVLRDSATATGVIIRTSSKGAAKTSLAVGDAVEIASVSTGRLLLSAGKVIAFIPNEVGKSLFQHSKHTE